MINNFHINRPKGFTLLELLVAMTVLGVLVLLTTSGLHFGTRIWERKQQQLEAQTDTQIARSILSRVLSGAIPLVTAGGSGVQAGTFAGSKDAFSFIGSSPTQTMAGGLYDYEVNRRIEPDGVALVLTWRLRLPESASAPTKGTEIGGAKSVGKNQGRRLTNNHNLGGIAKNNDLGSQGTSTSNPRTTAKSDTRPRSEVILVTGAKDVSFSYFGAEEPESPPRWHDGWHKSVNSPLIVRISVEFFARDTRFWPDLVVAPRVTLSEGAG